MKFFEYALTVREQREAHEKQLQGTPLSSYREGEVREPWLEAFQKPPFLGDMVNQEVFPWDQREAVPEAFRVPLLTQGMADAWR